MQRGRQVRNIQTLPILAIEVDCKRKKSDPRRCARHNGRVRENPGRQQACWGFLIRCTNLTQPTRGVDIGAAHIIHKKMMELRDQGCAVLLISADLSEALKLSDVIAVMYEGEIVAYFDNTEGLNEEKLGLYMLGLEKHSEEQIRRAEG